MTTYIDPISLLPPRFGEIYSDRNILLSGQASWGGIATPLLTTQGVSILVTPKGGGALSVCLLPNQTYALPVDGYTVWVKLNRSPGVHTLLFGTDVLIYDNVSIPTPSQDWLPAFTRFNDKCYAHGGFVIPSILTQIGLAKNSDYEIVVGSATDPRTTYTSLAQAVQDAQSGWSILVLSGTYSFAAPAQGGIDAQSALAWTGKTLYITGEGHSTVIQNTGSLTRAFGIQNSTGSIVKNITLQNFPQAVRFDASSDSILELWQAVAAGYTDPTYINASQNNQVNLNIESAGLSPSSQVRKYLIGASSYFLDETGNITFTGTTLTINSALTVNGTATFTNTVTVTPLTPNYAVVTNASKQLVSLQYTSADTANTLVYRDGSGSFSANTITADAGFSGGTGSFSTLSAGSTVTFSGLSALGSPPNQGFLALNSNSVRLITDLNPFPYIHIDGSTHGSISAGQQGLWLDWNRSGGNGEAWIINEVPNPNTGIGGIKFARSVNGASLNEWGGFEAGGNFYIANPSDSNSKIITDWMASPPAFESHAALTLRSTAFASFLYLSASEVKISSQGNPYDVDGICEANFFYGNQSYISGVRNGIGYYGKIRDVRPSTGNGDGCPVGTVDTTSYIGFDFVSYFPGNLLGLSPDQRGVAFYECTTPGAGRTLKFVIYQNNGINGVGGMYNP